MANKNSLIVNYILNHRETWQKDFKELGISVHTNYPYDTRAIFKYNIDCDFFNSLVREARGIIIDLETLDVIAWPFTKFGNYGESYADSIDWHSAHVQEKVDGSIIKLYWYHGEWYIATNGVIEAHMAEVNGFPGKTYGDLFKNAKNYKDIPFDELNHDYTYIFELVSPFSKIVIDYPETMLYHIGTRDNITGQEYNIDIGIQKPKEYALFSLEDAIQAAAALNVQNQDIKYEGFVVVDKDWHRVKVKSPEYLIRHRAVDNNRLYINKNDMVGMVLSGNYDENGSHAYLTQVRYYQYQLEILIWEIEQYIIYVRALYEEFSHDRGAVARMIKDDRLSYFGFKAIETLDNAKSLLQKAQVVTIARLLPDYELPNFLMK